MWILVFLLIILESSVAAAFECSDVTLPSSIVICSSPELARLADERQQIYNEARARLTLKQQKQLWEKQKAWVHSYAAACGVPPDRRPPTPVPRSIIECFKRAAEGRAAYLRRYGFSGRTMSASSNYLTSAADEPIHRIAPENFDEVPLKKQGGIFVIPVQINGAITLDFVIDSGASDVQIPVDVFSTLVRANTILPSDLVGKRKYTLADGSSQEEPLFALRELKVGNQTLRNVLASVAPSAGSLLLGQSFLSQFETWTLDNEQHVLKLVAKPAQSPPSATSEAGGVNQQGPLATITGTTTPGELQPSPQRAFLCGRPVDYSLDQSGSGSSFLGVWSGKWNNSAHLCGGLIVEKVVANGAADIIYVYGPSRPGSKFPWKEQHRIGFLSNDGKLLFRDDQGSLFAFDLIGDDLLQATFESRLGRLSGSFQKFR